MAKQKSGSPAKKGAVETKSCKLVRFRASDESEAHEVLQRALKRGAGRVGTRAVSPNQVEAFAEFGKKSNAAEFEAWLQKKHQSWLVDDLDDMQ